MNAENIFFNKIQYLETVDSTNTFLKTGEAEDRTVVYTFNQTSGRGRENRKWADFTDKNLALSILLKDGLTGNTGIINPVWIVAAVSLSVIDILKDCRIIDAWIKWPNDVYISDKKISGILAESSWNGGRLEKVIVGIGLNINTGRNDLDSIDKKAASILSETGIKHDLMSFSRKFISILDGYFNLLFEKNGINRIKDLWLSYSKFIGMNARWTLREKEIYGIVDEILDDGTIVLKSGDITHKIISGDVEILWNQN